MNIHTHNVQRGAAPQVFYAWSALDVFMVSIFAAIIQLPQFAQVRMEAYVLCCDPHGVAACRRYGAAWCEGSPRVRVTLQRSAVKLRVPRGATRCSVA